MQALRFNGEAIVKRDRESSLSGVDLELGLGINGGCGTLIKEEHGQVVFTRAQIQEFLLQLAIFRYMQSGLPVPISLVFPVWSSVACSLKVGSVQRHFPSFATLVRPLMEGLEPGRCRRSDGKKWRCSASVVPGVKYCERHTNRGSNRSRKHVEASQHASRSLLPAVSTSLDFTVSSSPPSVKGDLGGSSSHKGKSIAGDRNGARKRGSVGILADNCNPKKNKFSIHQSLNNFNPTNASDANVSNPGNNGSSDASFSPGFGYSPKSIPQHSNDTVSTRLELDHKIPEEKETEPHRCIRTDGKKWRCRQNVAPGKATCEVHMLRGKAKSGMEQRAMFDSNKVTSTQFSNPNENKPSRVENKISLNTGLSIKGGDSSSSGATTMTDDSSATISV